MRNFRELRIWQKSLEISCKIYNLTKSFPNDEKFGLISQMRRCSVSIPSNIAEGCRGSNKELKHFLNIALGSSFELETQMIIANRVGYLAQEIFHKISNELLALQKSINAFKNTIK